MVNKGPIVFIEGGNEAGTMNFEIDVENHCVKVYRGLAPQSKEEDWQ
ncbi:MAG TPA: hypothetical protein P5241_00750 [Candidatus Paceibacterota bacterium]|nr:hypothetical protein [Candidatus Paceibacterota bacterium]